MLLTNDRDLRTLAHKDEVSCHGTLWLLDMLLHSGLIEPKQAVRSLQRIVRNGAWLPKRECQIRLAEWRDDK